MIKRARRRKVLVKKDREVEKWESWQDKEKEVQAAQTPTSQTLLLRP